MSPPNSTCPWTAEYFRFFGRVRYEIAIDVASARPPAMRVAASADPAKSAPAIAVPMAVKIAIRNTLFAESRRHVLKCKPDRAALDLPEEARRGRADGDMLFAITVNNHEVTHAGGCRRALFEMGAQHVSKAAMAHLEQEALRRLLRLVAPLIGGSHLPRRVERVGNAATEQPAIGLAVLVRPRHLFRDDARYNL